MEQQTPKVGRPRLHPTRADKQFAYRQRKKAAAPPKDSELAERLRAMLLKSRASFVTLSFTPVAEKDVLLQLVEELEYQRNRSNTPLT